MIDKILNGIIKKSGMQILYVEILKTVMYHYYFTK